jgi:endoglucanase
MNKALLLLLLVTSLSSCAQDDSLMRIPLKVSESYANSQVSQTTEFLIDDNPQTRYHPTYPGYNSLTKPFRTTFLLYDYSPCIIKRLVFYDANGNGYNCRFILVREDDGQEVEIYNFTGASYLERVTVDLPANKQFAATKLILETPAGGDGYPDDLEIWGSFVQKQYVANTKYYPLKNFLGVNLHPWDLDSLTYPAKYKALVDLKSTMLRVYSDAYADKDSATGGYMLNPERRGFQTERTFASLKKDAPWVVPHICFQNQSLPIKATWDAAGKRSHLNFPYGSDRLNPETYTEISKDLFVLATRGGRNADLPDYPIYNSPNWWEPRQQMVKGGGFYDIIEGGNEWNAWWAAPDGYMNGTELGFAWSAMYDGHKKTIINAGAKAADSNITVSNGGVASDRPDILLELTEWSKTHRGSAGGKPNLPFDVYQYHCYPSSEGQYANSKGGMPPELGMVPKVHAITQAANKYANGVRTLIGEWGYDVHPESPQNAPAYSNYSAEQSRAHLAIRAILGFAQAGAWSAEWFRLYQDWPNTIYDHVGEQFATMALLRQMDEQAKVITRTLVGDYFKQFAQFGDYVFAEALRNDTLRVLKFKNGTKEMYALWTVEKVSINPQTNRPVYVERKIAYKLNLKGKILSFKDDGSGTMRVDDFRGSNLVCTAKPVFILPEETKPITQTGKKQDALASAQ